MKELLAEVKGAFSGAGYRKKRNSFWKREGGFYRLVDFQHGAYGYYFFINVGLHPVGLPSLVAGELVIKEQPKEYECIFHQRVGEISPIPLFQKALVPISDPGSVQAVLDSVPDIEAWFFRWCSFETLAGCEYSNVEGMLSCVPLLWKKAYQMLRCYCLCELGHTAEAEQAYSAYLAEHRELDFSAVDQYLMSNIEAAISDWGSNNEYKGIKRSP